MNTVKFKSIYTRPFFFVYLRVKPNNQKNRSLRTFWEATHMCINISQAMETIWLMIEGHSEMMWFSAVCWSAPQLQAGLLGLKPHLPILALKHLTPVHSLFNLTQVCNGRSDPGQLLNGETIYPRSLQVDGCHSAYHILTIQLDLSHWVGYLTGGLPFVGKGRRDFSLGCVSSLAMVWRDLGPWHGGLVPDLLLAYEALLMGFLLAHGAALLV